MENQKLEKTLLSDSELSEVSGGAGSFISGWFVYDNYSTYESGETAKYYKGQRVILQFEVSGEGYHDLICTVEDVTEKAVYGICYKEFGYVVRVISVPDALLNWESPLIGRTVSGVYESCLRPA